MSEKEIHKMIYKTFSNVASSLGYSEVHGRILAVLLATEKPISLNELAKTVGYSLSSISISIDLLELVGMVKKIRNSGDRKVYVKFNGDLLEGLKTAFLFKLEKELASTMNEFEDLKKDAKDAKTKKMINKLEKELQRLSEYVNRLSEVRIPE